MKSTTFIAVAAGLTACLVSAQIENIPQCALSCALTSLSSTGCAVTDIPCICTATSFIDGLLPCVQAACTPAELEATIAAAGELCSGAGASLSVPVPTGGASSTAAPSVISTVVSVSSQVSITSVTATAVETSTSSVVSTVIQTTKVATSTTLARTTIGGGANSTVITGTAPPVPTSTEKSSAGRNAVALGGLGAIVALVAALL